MIHHPTDYVDVDADACAHGRDRSERPVVDDSKPHVCLSVCFFVVNVVL